MGTEPTATAPMLVEEALNRALAGDVYGGGMLLVPLIEDSHRECFALCAMLATTCTHGLQAQAPDGMFVLEVEDVETGQLGRAEDLPPDAQFAAQFVTAWANRDEETARALFDALAADTTTEAGVGQVVDGVLALYGMAITSVRALIEEQRTNPHQEENR